MPFFGMRAGALGVDNPVGEMVKPGYKEPDELPKSVRDFNNKRLTFLEKMREIDPHIGTADGYPYHSIYRWKVMQRKQMRKPVGPTDIYKQPMSASQEIGWWSGDPLLKDAQWFKHRKFFPYPMSDMSSFKKEMIKVRLIWNLPGV